MAPGEHDPPTNEPTPEPVAPADKPVTHGEFGELLHNALEDALAPIKELLGKKGDGDGDGEPAVRMTLKDAEEFAKGVVRDAVKALAKNLPAPAPAPAPTTEPTTTSTTEPTTTTTSTAPVVEATPIGDARRLAKQEKRWGSA